MNEDISGKNMTSLGLDVLIGTYNGILTEKS